MIGVAKYDLAFGEGVSFSKGKRYNFKETKNADKTWTITVFGNENTSIDLKVNEFNTFFNVAIDN